MAYTTIAKVRRVTGFVDDTKHTDDFITEQITAADSVIDTKISDVYTTPLTTVPGIISTISLQIAKALCYAEENGEESQNTDKGWERLLNFYMDLLDQIQDQKIKLRDTSGVELTRNSLKSPSFKPTLETTTEGETPDKPRITTTTEF